MAYLVKTALPALQEGASKASRQVPPLVCHVPVAVSTDQRAVLEAVRKQLGLLCSHVWGGWFPSWIGRTDV